MSICRHLRALPWLPMLAAIAATTALAGCAHRPAATAQSLRWQQAQQLVLVTTADWDSPRGELRTYARAADGSWRAAAAPQPVTIGRAGAAWGIGLHEIPAGDPGPVKREGDGRSPAGAFAIGEAFGYASSAATALPYAAMGASDYCIDVSGSPYYNRIIDAAAVGAEVVRGSTEPMRRDLHADGDQRYRLGFVIEHNPRGTAQAGSCIFGHLWKTPDTPTAGCTAMAPATMQALLAWLDPRAQPLFVLLPAAEYQRLQAAWRLPRLP